MGEKHFGISSQNKIDFLWDSFVNAENKSYEKGVWLDVFLAEFLAQIRDGKNVEDVIPFSNSSTVSTLIACELLSDVHEICNHPHSGAPAGVGDSSHDDLSVLRKHLLTGRGWRCLAAIHCLGLQDLSCAKELTGLLISLYSVDNNEETKTTLSNPYVLRVRKQSRNLRSEEDISVRLQVPIRKKSRILHHHSPSADNNSPPLRYRKVSNVSINRRSANLDNQGTVNNKEASSESEMVEENNRNNINGNGNIGTNNNSGSPNHRANKNLKLRLNQTMDFDYYTCVVRSENEQRWDSESYMPGDSKRQKMRVILPEDFYDERINDVFKANLSVVELKFLIVDLLHNLTECENLNTIISSNNLTALADKSVSVQTLTFSLDALYRPVVRYSDSSNGDNQNFDYIQLKYNLTRLLLCSLEKLLKLPDVTVIVLQKGVIPIMKRLLEDVVHNYDNYYDFKASSDNVVKFSIVTEHVEFIYSLLYGGITLLHCLLLQNNSPEKLDEFLILFHQFNANKLIERCMFLLMKMSKTVTNCSTINDGSGHSCDELSLKRCKKIIHSVGHLITSLKKTRSKIVHIRNCKRSRHKHCAPLNVVHHHDTLFGNIFKNSVLPSETNQSCCVSTLFMILTKFLSESVAKEVVSYSMHIMMTCGTCCCFPSSQFITRLISVIQKCDYKMRNVALILLERTYYRQFGALHENSSCDTCFKNSDMFLLCDVSSPPSNTPIQTPQSSLSSSLTERTTVASSSSSSFITSSIETNYNSENEKRTVLSVFRDLLLSSDCNVSYSVGSHLLRVAPKCNLIIQKEMLFNVFYPAFLIAKKQFFDNKKTVEKDKYVLTTCLSAFTNLLSRVRFTEEFINRSALKHVEALLFEPDFIRLCCSIIEIVVIVQVWKSEHCGDNYKNRTGVDSDNDKQFGIEDLEMFLGHVKSATILLLKSVNEHNELSLSSNTSSTCSSFVSISIPNESLTIQEGIEMSESFINDSQDLLVRNEEEINTISGSPTSTLSSDHAIFSDINKWDSFAQMLENCSVLWRTCANITLYSPQLRKYFSKHNISKYCYDLLLKTLDGIAKHTAIKGSTGSLSCKLNGQCSSFTVNESFTEKFYNANQITLKLFESLLILNLISPVVDEKTGCLMTEDALLSVLRGTLMKTLASGHVNSRHLCDVLLRACSIAPSDRLVLPTHKMPKVGIMETPLWDNNSSDMSPPSSFYYNYIDADIDGIIDGNEVCVSNTFNGILPSDMATGDEGYEADIEVLEQQTVDEKASDGDIDDDDNGSVSGVRSLASSRKISAIGTTDARRDLFIVHPGLCTVTIHLLAHCLRMFESSNSCSTGEDDLARYLSDAVYCLQRLAALCQESSENCRTLNEHGILYLLLTQFKPFLAVADASFMGLQHALLNVVTRLTESSIEPKDLCQFLNLFTEDNPPLEALSNSLVNMVTSIRVQPSFILSFPTNDTTSPNMIFSSNRDPAEKLAISMRRQHLKAGFDSCWASSSVILGINQEMGWSMWNSGFSLSIWLCVDKLLSRARASSCRMAYNEGNINLNKPYYSPVGGTVNDNDQSSDNISKNNKNNKINNSNTNSSSGSGNEGECVFQGNRVSVSSATPTPTGLLHIVSVGYDLLTIEFWIDGHTNTIIVRLVRSDGGGIQEILAESSIASQLSPGLWHHMAISVQDSLQKRKVCIEVTILVDGWCESHVTLSFTGLLVRKSRPYCVAVGHHVNSTPLMSYPDKSSSQCHCGRWLLGNLMMFRAAVFDKETATYLSALGPDHTHLTETDVGNTRPNFSRLFTARAMSSGIAWDKLLNDHSSVMKRLQENLLLVYAAQTPNTVRLYPQITSSPSSGGNMLDVFMVDNPNDLMSVKRGWGFSQNVLMQAARQGQLQMPSPSSASSIVSSLLNSQSTTGYRVVTIDKRSSQHLPMCVTPAVNCMPGLLHTHTFISAVNTIGGISIFFFLFARVVELESNEEIQARALYLLLKLVQNSAEFNSEFVSQQQHKLLTLILSTKKCHPGLHMLKAILDTACDRPGLLIYHAGTGQFQICKKSSAVLVNPFLITGPILSAWSDWVQQPPFSNHTCLHTLMKCLLVLLREEHPQHEFNAAQLNRVNTVDMLLKICKERFMNDEPSYPVFDADTCEQLVELIATLMSSPPQTEHITAIVQFLILSHPAHATYVTHMRSSFYFILPTVSNSNVLNSSRKHEHFQKDDVHNSDDFINNARINIISNGLTCNNDKKKRTTRSLSDPEKSEKGFNFSVDPLKLEEALSDLQEKQAFIDKVHKNSLQEKNQTDNDNKTAGSIIDERNGATGERRLSKTDSTTSIGTSSISESLDGNGCDSGIAGSFKDNVDTALPKQQGDKIDFSLHFNTNDYDNGNRKHSLSDLNGGTLSSTSILSSAYEVKVHNKLRLLNFCDNLSTSEGDDNIYCNDSVSNGSGGNQNQSKDAKSSIGNKNNLDIVVEGLLSLLRNFILVLPDSKAEQVLTDILKMETLIIMSNHPNPRVRVAVIKLLSLYLERATEEELNRFLKSRGFYLLANQLHSQDATHELVGCVAALITGQHWLHIDDQLPLSLSPSSDSVEITLSPLQVSATPALFATMLKTVHDPPLAHSTILFLGRLFNKVPQMYKSLLEFGVIEVLLKMMLAISHQPISVLNKASSSSSTATEQSTEGPDCEEMWQRLLITDIHNTFILILTHALHSPGSYYMRVIMDLFLLLNYMERMEQRGCGNNVKCVYVLRTCHCILLATALDAIHNMIHLAQQSLPSRIRTTASALINSVFHNHEHKLFEASKSNLPNSDENHAQSSNNLYNRRSSMSSTSSLSSLMISSAIQFTQGELCDRYEMITVKALELIINNIPVDGCYSQLNIFELNFIDDVLTTLLNSATCIVDRRSTFRTSWTSVMWSCRDMIRTQTGKLLIWLLSPGQLNKVRVSVVNKLRNEHRSKEVFLFVFENNHQSVEQFLLYLWDLINGPLSSSLQPNELKDCEELNERLHSWGFVLPQDRPAVCCEEDVSLLWDRTMIEQKSWWKQQERCALRIISRMEGVIKSVNDAALLVSNIVTNEQNSERKHVIETLRNNLSGRVHTQILWKNIVRQLTHERAVWHFPKSYPRSWQLDPTEGPSRIRCRLQRCHLTVSKKYLKPEFHDKVDAAELPRPLSFLFDKEGEGQVSSMSALLIEKLHTDKKIRHMVTAQVITPAQNVTGELLIGETCLYFVPSSEETMKEFNAGSSDVSFSSQAWQFHEIKEVHTRRFQLKERALEIFLLNGKTYLLAFESLAERDKFQSELCQCDLPNRVAGDHLGDAVQLWREGHLTNWEYLTILNKMAGRSYNDLMQYPVMPFILADYTSAVLDLTNADSYRNLKKPMAVQDKKNEKHYINNYNYLKQEMELCGSNQGSYHYGSHYSNSGVVLHFLVRLPPFTSMFLTYQDDNFDLPDRTFHSLDTTWRLTSRESTTDVKELIPEFFSLPEFLTNIEGFDFGTRQNGEKVDSVTLPLWAENDPRKFILINRQALESDYVRENIPHWIDLVFGYKQTGKAAVEAINVFHPATYCGFDVEAIEDPLERSAWETMVRTYGQTPRQLFKTPHPMCVQSLITVQPSPSIHCKVSGIQWGNYAGSPGEPMPTVVYKHQHRLPITRLIPLLTNDVFGLAPSSSLLLTYSKNKSLISTSATGTTATSISNVSSGGGLCVHGAAMVFWGHTDGVLRVKMKRDLPPYPVARPPGSSWDVITQCTSAPDTNQLWVGYSSGRILVYKYRFVAGQNCVEFSTEPYSLVGHTSPVLSISLSHGFNVALTGCQDGVAILWDMNSLSYIRSLPSISMPVHLTCISETTGDIVTIGHDIDNSTSTLRLHSINVSLLGSITTDQRITAVCFSTAPEGVSVNVIVTGMQDGTIKFWSTWDLSPCGNDLVLPLSEKPQPILCLMYSHDSHHLYASVPSGHVVIWESKTAGATGKQPKFLNLSNLSN